MNTVMEKCILVLAKKEKSIYSSDLENAELILFIQPIFMLIL